MNTILELKKVGYQIHNKQILNNINMNIKEGEHWTLVGPSGAGKTTILMLMAQMISPTAGEIMFKSQDIKTFPPTDYRRSVSYCFQQPTLFGKTVRDNLEFPFQIRKQDVDVARMEELLELVNLPKSYLENTVNELSGGEKQRIALIRNLMIRPDIILLDEVTTGLDAENKEIVHNLIESFHHNNGTIVQITHDEGEIKGASKIFELKKITDKAGDKHE
ncbi:ABC transporter ATP-binding protein [Pediococcus claussenii]|uniref:ABC transporter, ATP-binding protein n=1 Tax=Pediococcus claussenii (strain ATCC BAA-344 / DSM 14800 / JCM 18046 / KCTC 3811 / LMG 21948 / P06) TaxID=701521 RepID=G8PCB9_PEDCP|nr:ATP-binding cassette domain-containing protein [Pediococcus claussenii]AEV94904.1 ABC transporter, ATP-binding protein [Pediococcus claussenii ATCC BAA-344]ANZ70100.1 spermidine/putrescine ABC transporter ATP-binding protein [Pediococcus claussenii]ANZ71915.1 spermidine/putrescine ABC transporter ATP-binding protein [Pediococcus claussenii]KRN18845.1 hypothetical protein IV79_GL000343 [Pediococcus claussenii]